VIADPAKTCPVKSTRRQHGIAQRMPMINSIDGTDASAWGGKAQRNPPLDPAIHAFDFQY
jgi:hypothetical protein